MEVPSESKCILFIVHLPYKSGRAAVVQCDALKIVQLHKIRKYTVSASGVKYKLREVIFNHANPDLLYLL